MQNIPFPLTPFSSAVYLIISSCHCMSVTFPVPAYPTNNTHVLSAAVDAANTASCVSILVYLLTRLQAGRRSGTRPQSSTVSAPFLIVTSCPLQSLKSCRLFVLYLVVFMLLKLPFSRPDIFILVLSYVLVSQCTQLGLTVFPINHNKFSNRRRTFLICKTT